MAAASSNTASGRVVVGWFPPQQRGLVMGIRQTAQPLGVGLGALVIPRLAESHGVSAALLFPAVVCAVAAVVCAIGVLDPPRPPRAEAIPTTWPTRTGARRRCGASTRCRCFWSCRSRGVDVHAGVADDRPRLVGGVGGRAGHHRPGAGAAGRIAAGRWSDMVGSRLQPIRTIARRRGRASMGLLALTDWLNSPISVAMMVVASVITVSDNGLSVHRDRRDRRAVLERASARHPEHQPATHRRCRSARVRRVDRRGGICGGVRGLCTVPAARDTAGPGRIGPADQRTRRIMSKARDRAADTCARVLPQTSATRRYPRCGDFSVRRCGPLRRCNGRSMLLLRGKQRSVDKEGSREGDLGPAQEQVGRAPESVECPDNLKGEVGATTRCTLNDAARPTAST